MVPGYFGGKNSIQLRLYACGLKYGSFIIAGKPIKFGILPEEAYIYHTRKLERYKNNYTHPTKKNPDGSKMKFKPGDMKGDPVLMLYKKKDELEKALEVFPMVLQSMFDGIVKEVWCPNPMICDTFCSVPRACVGGQSVLIDQDTINEAKERAKQLGL